MNIESIAGDVVSIGADLGLWPHRPAGDPQGLRDAATRWVALARGLQEVIGDARARIIRDEASWRGPGKDAFVREWTHLASTADQACDQLAQVGGRLLQAADKLEQAQKEYDVMVAGKIAALAVGMTLGTALAPVTLGGSEAAAAGGMAEEFAVSIGLSAEAATLINTAVTVAVEVAEQIAVRFAVAFGVDLGTQAGASVVEFHSLFHVDVRAALGDALANAAPHNVPLKSLAGRTALTAGLNAGLTAAGEEAGSGQVDLGTVLFGGVQGALGPLLEHWFPKPRG